MSFVFVCSLACVFDVLKKPSRVKLAIEVHKNEHLYSVQRFSYLVSTSAIESTPQGGLETKQDIPSLEIFMKTFVV